MVKAINKKRIIHLDLIIGYKLEELVKKGRASDALLITPLSSGYN
jgi:hypothetical protein